MNARNPASLARLCCGGLFTSVALALYMGTAGPLLHAGPLEEYVRRPDATSGWKILESTNRAGLEVLHVQLTSQTWHGNLWVHDLQIVRPAEVRNPQSVFLLISGDGDGLSSLSLLRLMAERAGTMAAVLTSVPFQPLYERKEDALIAYTFDQYLRTDDATWPLLLPMVKSAVRAMDAIQEVARTEYRERVDKFVVSGASKRGWTTWLTGAVDPRVQAIAPMVIDMLNMKAQTQWARRVYGRQSEQIRDYTDLNLIEKMDTPPMQKLVQFVDPFAYRSRYNMPKLLLLGTNDPYWTVDSLRHYWDELPGAKLIFQTPNAGHDLAGGRDASQTLAAFYEMVVEGKTLPKMNWEFIKAGARSVGVEVKVDQPAKTFRLWTADCPDRDFRKARWTAQPLAAAAGGLEASTNVAAQATGFRASLVEAILVSPSGHEYRLSTEARVVPDLP